MNWFKSIEDAQKFLRSNGISINVFKRTIKLAKENPPAKLTPDMQVALEYLRDNGYEDQVTKEF